MHATMGPASGPTSLTIHTRHATTSPGDLISITTFHVGSSGARVFRTPQLFRLRDDLESNLLRPKRRGLYWTEIALEVSGRNRRLRLRDIGVDSLDQSGSSGGTIRRGGR